MLLVIGKTRILNGKNDKKSERILKTSDMVRTITKDDEDSIIDNIIIIQNDMDNINMLDN